MSEKPGAAETDPYHVLGVPRGASLSEVRRAYRRLALAYHPDRPGGEGDRMAAINRAYAQLLAGLSSPAPAAWVAAPTRAAPEPAPAAQVQVEDDRPWRDDLLTHALDWRQALEEERRTWERLLASAQTDGPRRAGLEVALDETRAAQVCFENDLRATRGESPLSEEAIEKDRAAALGQRAATTSATGCLLPVVGALGVFLTLGRH